MANENSLGSWIDQDRLAELLDDVRPGSLRRSSLPLSDSYGDDSPGRPQEPAESLLADEIPSHVFMKSLRPKLPAPEPRPPRAQANANAEPEPMAIAPAAPLQPMINPLNLYFHSTAPTPEARAKAFVRWVCETSGAHAAFVVDAYGAAIAAEPATDPVFLASLSNLADALGRGRDHFSQPDQSALLLEMGDDQVLCVVQAKWEVATVALGMLCQSPITREVAVRYRQELAKLAHKPRRRPRD